MDAVSVGPLKVATLRWQARPGAWVLTVVCKATYRLQPGESALAEAQEPPNEDDNHWDDDPGKSLRFACDLVPYKARADVLLTGSAYAPSGRPTSSLLVRLIAGEVDKTIAVRSDAAFAIDGSLREGPRFSKMPLRWERAAGGPDTSNPTGIDPTSANASGEVLLPNLLSVGYLPQRRGEIMEPVGFGPIAASWPGRRDKLGPLAGRFSLQQVADSVLPREIDAAFFQAAPRDQQAGAISEDMQIVLEHLHPQHARLATRLPGLRPRAFVDRPNAPPAELPARPDTLAIDTDRGLATLVWRAQLILSSRDEPGRVLVGMEGRDTKLAWPDLARSARALSVTGTVPAPPTAADDSAAESLSDDDYRMADETLIPRVAPPDPRTADETRTPRVAAPSATETLFLLGAPAAQTMPFAQGDRDVDTLRRAEQAAVDARSGVLPAGWAPPSPLAAPAAGAGAGVPASPPAVSFSSSGSGGPASPEEVPRFLDEATASLPVVSDAAPMPAPPPMVAGRPAFVDAVEAPPLAPPPKPVEVAIAPALVMSAGTAGDAAKLGVAGLSNAAAGAQEALAKSAAADVDAPRVDARPSVEPSRPAAPGEAYELLWHSPELAKKLRRDLRWRRLFLESDLEPPAENELEVMSEEDAETPEEADRRRIADAMGKGTPVNIAAVREAVRKGVRSSGRFEAPLLLLEGELEVSFDEVETLRAITAAAAPFASLDKRVKDAVDAAQEALRSAWIQGAGPAADVFSERVREAFTAMRKDAQGPGARRTLPADYLDGMAARSLTMGRHYSKRPVYGEPYVRASLRLVGGEEKLPVYLLEDAAKRLPLSAKHRVRLFAEVGPKVDAVEASRWAGRALAIGGVQALD